MRTYDERLKLYEDNKGLAYSLSLEEVNKNERLYMWKDDILQEALLELWRVTNTYNDSRGVKFSTYAYNNIWGAIRKHIDRVIIKRDRYTGEVPIIDTLDKPVNFSNSRNGDSKETVLDLLIYEDSREDIDDNELREFAIREAYELHKRGTLDQMHKIITLRLEGLTHKQISKYIDYGATTVKNRLQAFKPILIRRLNEI